MIANFFQYGCSAFALAAPVSIAGAGILMWPLLVFWLGACVRMPAARPHWGVPEKIFLAFTIVGALSAWFGVDIAHGLRFWSKKDVYFLIIPFVCVWMNNEMIRVRYGRLLILGGCLAAAWGCITFLIGVNQTDSHGGTFLALPAWMAHWPRRVLDGFSLVNGRAIGFRSHPLTYAETLVIVLAVLLPLLALRDRRRLLYALFGSWILFAALLFSQSRGPWLAATVMLGVTLLFIPKLKTVGRLFFLLLPGVFVMCQPAFIARAASILDQHYMSNSERIHMWRVGFIVWKTHPVLGIGPGNVKRVVGPYETPEELVGGPWGHLHNTFVNMAVERGVVGVLLFIGWLGALAYEFLCAWRRADFSAEQKRWALSGILALVGFIFSGFTETIYNDEAVLFTWYAVLGVALAGIRRES